MTTGKRGLTDWLFESRGRFEEIQENDSMKNLVGHAKIPAVPVPIEEDPNELIFVSEQNTKKRRTSRDQAVSTLSDGTSGATVPVQMVAPMIATVAPMHTPTTVPQTVPQTVPRTVTPPVRPSVGKSPKLGQKSNSRSQRCLAPLVVNYLNDESMNKFSSDIQNSLQKLLKANNLAPRN